MDKITFFVPGVPRGKGRPRFNKATGTTYTDSETKAYEKKIEAYYRNNCGALRFRDGDFVRVNITAFFSIPTTAGKTVRAAMAAGEILPSRKPDIDNIIKVVLDALNGVAYKDDARVAEVTGGKRYGATPGVTVLVEKL